MTKIKDPLGEAVKDFYSGNTPAEIIVKSDYFEDDIIPVSYLFRTYDEFPELEKIAIEKSSGKILDVGAGAGCHSLVLQSLSKDVFAIDTSEGAVSLMKKRGVENTEQINFYDLRDKKFDTILLLMNGIGIAGTIEGLDKMLLQCKKLLSYSGQILLDSTDISYIFREDDGSMWIDLNANYYGEVNYQMNYNSVEGDKFDWLYIDYTTLEEHASKNGFKTELLFEKEENFLARLTITA